MAVYRIPITLPRTDVELVCGLSNSVHSGHAFASGTASAVVTCMDLCQLYRLATGPVFGHIFLPDKAKTLQIEYFTIISGVIFSRKEAVQGLGLVIIARTEGGCIDIFEFDKESMLLDLVYFNKKDIKPDADQYLAKK
ncbi:MAG: hypothetical protein NTW50_02220 [Candidatus Berkelbacteria bacterium]|nr:hypothetical protein [Candidatus Berkelbacteria bacterium]